MIREKRRYMWGSEDVKEGKDSKEKIAKKKAYIQSLKYGTTRKEAAEAANVDTSTIWQWAKDDEQFAKDIDIALESRIKVVEDALFKLASGHIRLKNGKPDLDKDGNVQMTQGNVIAQIFYLKNRGKGEWTDKTELEFIAPKVVKRNKFIQAGEEPVIEEEEVPEKEILIEGDHQAVIQKETKTAVETVL